MGDTSSEKSLDVFDDGRDDRDNASVRTTRTTRSVSTRNPLRKIRTLETVIPPEDKNPPPLPRTVVPNRYKGPTAKYKETFTRTYPSSYGPYRYTS